MQRGYIKVWRKIEDSGLLQLHGTLALFLYMVLQASYKDKRIGLTDISRGQFISGRHKLGEAVGLSERSVRTCLEHLHKMDMITSKPTNHFTIYTIVNYNNYQDIDTTTDQQTDQQPTNNRPATVQRPSTTKEGKKERREEETTSASDDAGASVIYTKAFLTFWDMYPIKKNKGSAFKAFKKIKPAEYPTVKTGLISKMECEDWTKDNGQFIPHPASWLNARGWEDEVVSDRPKIQVKSESQINESLEARRLKMAENAKKILAMPVPANPWYENNV